jgi:hypothetical protein
MFGKILQSKFAHDFAEQSVMNGVSWALDLNPHTPPSMSSGAIVSDAMFSFGKQLAKNNQPRPFNKPMQFNPPKQFNQPKQFQQPLFNKPMPQHVRQPLFSNELSALRAKSNQFK